MEKIDSLQDLMENSPALEEITEEDLLAMARFYGYDEDVGCEFDIKIG